MNQNRLHLINKIFNNTEIGSVWNKEDEKYYISIVDVIEVLTESKDCRKYWNKLKQRLKEEGNQTVTNCSQLKLKSADDKYRLTDNYDMEVSLTSKKKITTRKLNKINILL